MAPQNLRSQKYPLLLKWLILPDNLIQKDSGIPIAHNWCQIMDFYFLWLPRTKAVWKAKHIFESIIHSIQKRDGSQSAPVEGLEHLSSFFLLKIPCQSLVMPTREQRGEGSKLPLTLLIHRESPPPHKFFIPLTFSPSDFPWLLPRKTSV